MSMTVEALAKEIHRLIGIHADELADGLLPFIKRHIAAADITRLADAADARAKWGLSSAGQDSEGTSRLLELIAAELRTLAQQGKAGGVAEVRSISDDIMDVVDRLGSESDDVDPRCWDHLRIYVPPANPPEAGVTDEMVDRLAKHLCREEWKDRCPTMEQMAAQLIHARRYHDEARAMLTAALAPQPKDAT